jgi:hypothetical protein
MGRLGTTSGESWSLQSASHTSTNRGGALPHADNRPERELELEQDVLASFGAARAAAADTLLNEFRRLVAHGD